MATVRFSNELRHSILLRADNLFNSRIDDINKNVVHEDVYKRVVAPILEPIVEKAKEVPDQFLMFTKDVLVRVKHPQYGSFRREYTLPTEVICPKKSYPALPGVRMDAGYSNLTVYLALDALPEDLRKHTDTQCTALFTLRDEARTFRNSVEKLINHYATLGPALKEWPPLWDLLTPDVQNRHKEVSEKRKRPSAKEELDLSLDRMTGTVVANKLSGKL